jgi:BarA-like signal transduction histidine kinase
MRAVTLSIVGAVVLLSQAPSSSPASRQPSPADPALDPELHRTWKQFAQAVRRHDLPALRQHSTACISCLDCLQNTPAEEKAFEQYSDRHPNTGYDRVMGSLRYIPAETFWRQDSPLIFDVKTTSRLLTPAKLTFIASEQNKAGYVVPCLLKPAEAASARLYEVLLTTIDPYPSGQGEGMQKAFAFIKTKQGYKFCGYDTIP